MKFLTEVLNPHHKKKEFTCGNAMLDNYLHQRAKQDMKRKLSACFILADENQRVKGYYTLSSTSVPRAILPDEVIKKLPASYHDLPATLPGRLAVDNAFKGQRIGETLLVDALLRSHEAAGGSAGSMAVIVDPIDANAEKFYTKYGFILLPASGKMFIPMETVAKVFI